MKVVYFRKANWKKKKKN